MKTKYEKPTCEVILLETENGVMVLSNEEDLANPTVNTDSSSDDKNFWGR